VHVPRKALIPLAKKVTQGRHAPAHSPRRNDGGGIERTWCSEKVGLKKNDAVKALRGLPQGIKHAPAHDAAADDGQSGQFSTLII
jgi:hypothetical protein